MLGKKRFHGWDEIWGLEPHVQGFRVIRGQNQDLRIPFDLRNDKRLIQLMEKLLEARGELPEETRQPGPPIPAAALSRAPRPESPLPNQGALSRAENPEEETEKEYLLAEREDPGEQSLTKQTAERRLKKWA